MATLVKKRPVASKPSANSTNRNKASQRDRLSCRIDSKIKQRAEEAATLLGQDLTAFTETALDEKAQVVIERQQRIILSERDFERFVESINNPEPPTPALIRARQAFRQKHQKYLQGSG